MHRIRSNTTSSFASSITTALLVGALLLSSAAHAQERELEEVVATGTRINTGGWSWPWSGGFAGPGNPLFGEGIGVQFNPGDNTQVRDAAEKDCAEQSGNPVVLSTGNKIESTLDFASAAVEMPLQLRRTYNHYWNYTGIFGRHWVSSFDYSLVAQGSTVLWAQRADGRRIRYLFNAGNQRFEEEKAGALAWIVRNPDLSYTHHSETGDVEQYDRYGYIQQLRNRQNIGWTFAYNGTYLTSVTHSSGQSVQLNWSAGQLISVTDPATAVYTYSYDSDAFGAGEHRLRSVLLPGTPTTEVRYHYEKAALPGALTGISWAGQRYANFDYDSLGRTTLSEHVGTVERHSFVYTGTATVPTNPPPRPPRPGAVCDPNTGICNPLPRPAPSLGQDSTELERRLAVAQAADLVLSQTLQLQSVTETNPLGKQTEYRFVAGELNEIIGAASTHCLASYSRREHDSRGYLVNLIDFNNNSTTYTHSPHGLPQTRIQADGTPLARTTTTVWDVPNRRPDSRTVTGDHRQTWTWRTDHRLGSLTTRNLKSVGTANEDRTTQFSYTFHASGLPATLISDGPLPGTGDAITQSWNALGFLTEVRNSLGHRIAYSQHNARGQPGRILGINGEVVDYQYDERGRMTLMRTFRDNGKQDTIWQYAASGLLQSLSTPDGVTESYTYDTARRLTVISRNQSEGTLESKLFYDGASNVIRQEFWRNQVLIQRAYTDYDELNRVRAVRGNAGQNTRYQYDTNNNLTHVIQTLGQTTVYEYDARNRLRQVTEPGNRISIYAYDQGDRLSSVTDPRNRITTYQYDGFGQLWSQDSPDTGMTTQVWDAGGLRTSMTRADGVEVQYGHDALGRPTSRSAGGQTHTTVWDSCTFGKGRICQVNDPHQSLSLSYTIYGELAEQTPIISGASGYAHAYQYDALGRLVGISQPGNVSIHYGWTLDRVTTVSATINGVSIPIVTDVIHTQNQSGIFRDIRFPNNRSRQEYSDLDGRLSGIVADSSKGFGYSFDSNNRLIGLTNFANGDWSQTYGYNDQNRLTSATSAGLGNQQFQYDANGNRSSHTVDGATTVHSIDPANNRLSSLSGATTRSYTYKPTGQVQSMSLPPAPGNIFASGFEDSAPNSLQFSYDPHNRLSAINGGGINASYKIAGTDMRVEKTVGGNTTRFVYGLGGQLLYEHDLNPARSTYHVYLHGQPIAMIRGNAVYTALTDHLGRPEVLVNAAGTTVWRANLRAFDRQVIVNQIGGYQLGFPGQYHDDETGYAYNIHRDYDPGTGRYLQSDPIGLAGGLNTYGYVGGNPVRWVDPLGLKCGCPGMGPVKRIGRSKETLSPHSANWHEATRNAVYNRNMWVGGVMLTGALNLSPAGPWLNMGVTGAYAYAAIEAGESFTPYVSGDVKLTTFYSQADRVHMRVAIFDDKGQLKMVTHYSACGPND